jgi:E3 ubiquitin-protein ligase SIAH1
LDGCTYDGFRLYDHILDEHIVGGHATEVDDTDDRGTRVTLQKDSPCHALLHPDGKRLFMLLNGGDIPTGSSLSLVRVRPRPGPDEEEAEGIRYEMWVRGDELGWLSLTACVRRWDGNGYQPERFLFVPDAFWGSSASITVTVYIYL